MQLVQYLDFPPLPDHLIKRVFDLVDAYQYKQGTIHNINGKDTWVQDGPDIKFHDNDLGISVRDIDLIKDSLAKFPEKTVCTFLVVDCDDDLKDWIRKNIVSDFYSVYILVGREGNTVLPHIDQERALGYNFIVQSSGKPLNCFWKPKEEFKDRPLTPYSYVPYERIELDKSYYVEPRRWHIIEASQVHSVEGLDPNEARILVAIGVNNK